MALILTMQPLIIYPFILVKQAVLSLLGDSAAAIYRSGAEDIEYPIHQSQQTCKSDASKYPLTEPLPKVMSKKQVNNLTI